MTARMKTGMKRSVFLAFVCILCIFKFPLVRSQCGPKDETTRIKTVICESAIKPGLDWCNCQGSPTVRLAIQIDEIRKSPLLSYNVGDYNVIRCPMEQPDRLAVCLCNSSTICITCSEENLFCLRTDEGNNVITYNRQTLNSCDVTSLCSSKCYKHCNPGMTPSERPFSRFATQPPPMRNMTIAATPKTTDGPASVDVMYIVAGAGVGLIIVVLILILVCYCRRRDSSAKKKQRNFESVYSTIEDNGIIGPTAQAHQNGNAYPNQIYDGRIGTNTTLPFRPEPPPHHKSLPSLLEPAAVPPISPNFPQQQHMGLNVPAKQMYVKIDGTTGYTSYDDSMIPSSSPYMYLTKERLPVILAKTHQSENDGDDDANDYMGLIDYQDPNSTPSCRPNNRFQGEPQTSQSHIRNQRSLPTDDNRDRYEERSNATYGFEKRKPNHRSLPREKPIPAKRGIYKSTGGDSSENVQDENHLQPSERRNTGERINSDDGSVPGSPYYFQVNHDDKFQNIDATDPMNDPDYQQTNLGPKEEKSARRKPKSRKKSKQPGTKDEKMNMIDNPMSPCSLSDNEGSDDQYSDTDLDDGLEELGLKTLNRDAKPPTDDAFEDGDYQPPEIMIT